MYPVPIIDPNGLSRRPQQDGDEEYRDHKEDFMDWIDQLHGFLHQINVIDICPPPTSDSLPLPFPHISTEISVRRTLVRLAPPIPTWMTTHSHLGQHKQKSVTLTSSKFFSGYKILDD
jgi:hypothetical protein